MQEKIKSTLWALAPFGLALWLGYTVTFQMTGSVGTAIERMMVIVVIWLICALAWHALYALREFFIEIRLPSGNRGSESRPQRG